MAAVEITETVIDEALTSHSGNRKAVARELGISLDRLKSRIHNSELLRGKWAKANRNLDLERERLLAAATGLDAEASQPEVLAAESRMRAEQIGLVQQTRREIGALAALSKEGRDQIEAAIAYMRENGRRNWDIITGYTMLQATHLMAMQEKMRARLDTLISQPVKTELDVVEQKALLTNMAEFASVVTKLFSNVEKNAILRSQLENRKNAGPKGKPAFAPITAIEIKAVSKPQPQPAEQETPPNENQTELKSEDAPNRAAT